MKRKWRRYELLLPKRFNNGDVVPRTWLVEAADEIGQRFDGVSLESSKIEGRWVNEGTVYRDVLARIVVDVLDTPQNRQWLKKFKVKWKKKLDQLELWMISYPIQVE